MSYYVTDDLFNKVEGMSKAQILALIENANYTPSFYAGALDNGVSYLYTGIKPTDALLKAILEHGLGNHTLTDIELDAINANVFSVLFFDVKTIVARSDGINLYINIVGEKLLKLSSSSRVVTNYATEDFVKTTAKEEINKNVPKRKLLVSNNYINSTNKSVNLEPKSDYVEGCYYEICINCSGGNRCRFVMKAGEEYKVYCPTSCDESGVEYDYIEAQISIGSSNIILNFPTTIHSSSNGQNYHTGISFTVIEVYKVTK